MSDTTDLANHNRLALECSPGSGILDGRLLNDLVDIAGVFEKRPQDSKSTVIRQVCGQTLGLGLSIIIISLQQKKEKR